MTAGEEPTLPARPLLYGVPSLPGETALVLIPVLRGQHEIGWSKLVEALEVHAQRELPERDVDDAVAELVAAGFVEERERGQTTRIPLPNGKFLTLPQSPLEPADGERAFGLTRMGQRLLHFLDDQRGSNFAFWMFGPERLPDTVLAFARSASRRDAVEDHLYWISPTQAAAEVDALVATGDVEEKPSGALSVRPRAVQRAARLVQEHQQIVCAEAQRVAQRAAAAGAAAAGAAAEPQRHGLDVAFVPDGALREVLERNVSEFLRASEQGLHTAAVVLAGSVAEGLLFEILRLQEPAARSSAKGAPRRKEEVLPLDEWRLVDLINVAAAMGLIRSQGKATAHVHAVREFRNVIHPRLQATDAGLRPDHHAVGIARILLSTLVEDLRPRFAAAAERGGT